VLLYVETDDLAEFRLWVRPSARGGDHGRALVDTVIETARVRGSGTLGLTTPPWSDPAQRLSASMGFEHTDPHPETRLPEQFHDDAVFVRLDLAEAGGPGSDG
jgi:GNAT superfamily N-acetyltransferase